MRQKASIPALVVLLMATAILTSGQGTWNKLEVPVTCSLNSLFFTDSLYGWV